MTWPSQNRGHPALRTASVTRRVSDGYARLLMMPGMSHCTGVPGPDRVDWYSAIDNWVEKAKAPERMVATKMASGKLMRSRALCAYPLRAVYKGTGSIDDKRTSAVPQ